MTVLDELLALLSEFESQEEPRVVVRWVDETRAISCDGGGYTVGNVRIITLTGVIDGGVRRQTFRGVGREEFRRSSSGFHIEFIERADNIVR